LGTKLSLSVSFHPQTDGQSEWTIQTLEDMLHTCVLSWKGSWEDQLALVEFAYNNINHASIEMAPYEALCLSVVLEDFGRKVIGWSRLDSTGY
jgi:anti-sigma regulatory factor (Ser/Thr protein kinase)